ncbi:Pyoverdine/dityrosine biosynthesis protein-domain-containing protein [Tricladium varicosporioides]|nr:Pyoverdine/dityrosine biosynthesis protein-domain-containing protein [Hymenoscyphus varicosporioides]
MPTNGVDIANKILQVLRSYSPPGELGYTISRPAVEESVRRAVASRDSLHFVLPAFPFKSPNSTDKVLGTLPDLGEEIALARLEGLCVDLERQFQRTTRLSIVSDGIVYNNLLNVSEETVWRYGSALRQLATDRFPHISFVRLNQIVAFGSSEPSTVEEYVQSAGSIRNKLVDDHIPVGFDVRAHLQKDISALMTYRGYLKFLKTDLKYAEGREGASKNNVKRMNSDVAKKMIVRGTAFSNAVMKAFPNSIRLSIHASVDERKLPIALFPGKHSFTTPWHASCTFCIDGTVKLATRAALSQDSRYQLVTRDGQPSHFQEISSLYLWEGVDINITPIYPCGISISPRSELSQVSIQRVDMLKVRALAELNSPVVLRGFSTTPLETDKDKPMTDLDIFLKKGREMGPILPWKFGEVLIVKDAGAETGGLNNVLSAEPMPFHFDGLFKTVKVAGPNGKPKLVPQPPQFQIFRAATPSPLNTGLTLFSSSRLLFENLPAPLTVKALSGLTWCCQTTAFNATKLSNLDLVVPHPSLGTPCLRYHEPWGRDRTLFDPTIVKIENGPEELLNVIDELLYDSRICYRHSWRKGDWLVNDNVAMMHTRGGFVSGSSRELWRLHAS